MGDQGKYRPAMVFAGEGKVWLTASASFVDTVYITILKADGDVTCTCRGFSTHKHCWHSDEALEQYEGPEPGDFQVSL